MTNLTRSQTSAIKEAMSYPRGHGYVLDFSDRTFQEFFEDEFGVDIFAPEYEVNGTSKCNRLTTFLQTVEQGRALSVLRALWDRREGLLDSLQRSDAASAAKASSNAFQRVLDALQAEPAPLSAAGVEAFTQDRTLEELVADIERTLAANKPEVAIDHLHTYCMKKFAHLLDVRGQKCEKDEPLHSRFARYRKCLEEEQNLHEFTHRALKSFISLFESFNDLRNNHSLAHDNQLLLPMEARLIFSSVSAILVMLRAIESARYGE
jgi:hypothetical protein